MTIRTTKTKLEVTIAAPAARVWEVLTTGFASWWPNSFNATGPDATMRLELFPGGRMFEERDGGGLLWGTVAGLKRGEQLQVAGDAFPQWGGPARNYATWTLVADGERTVVRFEDVRLGVSTDEGSASLATGWTFLLECLRATVEERPKPQWNG